MSSKNRVVDLRGGRNVPPPSPGDIRPREPRRSSLKERKKKMRAVISAAVSVCALLTVYSLHAASYLPRFTYQNVSVVGAHTVQPAQIQAFVANKLAESSRGFISGRNIFIYRYGQLADQIAENFPAVKSAIVKRDTSMGNGLIVTLTERTSFAQWCQDGTDAACFLMDEQGVIFASAAGLASSTLPNPYVFSGALSTTSIAVALPPYGEVFGGEHFEGINEFLEKLRTTGVTPLGANIVNDTDFSVPLAEGYYIKASFGEDPSLLAKNLSLILNADALSGKLANLEYVDLRFGNRVYYKFKGQAAPDISASSTPTGAPSSH
jgi:hypothetical protein